MAKLRARYGELTDNQILYLMHGEDFFVPRPSFRSEEEARKAWFDHRDELMARKSKVGGFGSYGPGERPWGWKRFELKEKLRIITRRAPVAYNKWEEYEVEEDDIDFLRRKGLLEPGEEEAYQRAHFPDKSESVKQRAR